MSEQGINRLYSLLPAVYRVRDAERGEPLRTLMDVIAPELDGIAKDIAGLYDNWFIETCDEWVVPYIGDLLAVRPIAAVHSAGVSTRAYVANTLAYRRRKGTALVLEQLARDTTGWPAHAVEMFQHLITTQDTNHVRLQPRSTPPIRDAALAELAGTAFEACAHLPELRSIDTRGGRYNIPNIGLFLWRLQSYGMQHSTARRLISAIPNTFAFRQDGFDSPLFNPGTAESSIEHLAEEQNVPGRLRRLVLEKELAAVRQGNDKDLQFMPADNPALRVFARLDGAAAVHEVERRHIYMCALPADVATASPPPLAVAVDPSRGRLRFPASLNVTDALVTYHYGFPGDLGGGPYDRTASLVATTDSSEGQGSPFFAPHWQAGVSHTGETGTSELPIFPSLAAAVAAWNAGPPGRIGVIALMDNETDELPVGAVSPPGDLEILLKQGSRLLIASAGWPRQPDGERRRGTFVAAGLRSHVLGNLAIRADASWQSGVLFLNGLLIEGSVEVLKGRLDLLCVQHCTLVPGRGGLRVQADNDGLIVRIGRSIVGGIGIDVRVRRLEITDSIVTSASGSPELSVIAHETECALESCTVESGLDAQTLQASNCLFAGVVEVARRQLGCVRFSYVPPGSHTPRRYQCQPDVAVALATADKKLSDAEASARRAAVNTRVRPLFVSLDYGDPELGQLELRCPEEIRTGAEDGSEMGAYRFLQQPHREANLRTVLQEYLRFGLAAGAIIVT